jgi:hypothetical protein
MFMLSGLLLLLIHLSPRNRNPAKGARRCAQFPTRDKPTDKNGAGEKDPNVSKLVSHRRPSLAWDDTPAPSGNRSPDLLLPGLGLFRGFSRSASRPHGQVFGGASTSWSYSRRLGRRGGCIGTGHGPAIPASGSIQISAFLRLLNFGATQTRAMSAAAVELLWRDVIASILPVK